MWHPLLLLVFFRSCSVFDSKCFSLAADFRLSSTDEATPGPKGAAPYCLCHLHCHELLCVSSWHWWGWQITLWKDICNKWQTEKSSPVKDFKSKKLVRSLLHLMTKDRSDASNSKSHCRKSIHDTYTELGRLGYPKTTTENFKSTSKESSWIKGCWKCQY